MAWIESHQELANHPKTKRLRRVLGLSQYEAIGALHMLWWWALEYAQDGDLSDYSDDDIADAISWPGKAADWVAGLFSAGFLNPDRSLHDWYVYAGKLIQRRQADAERKRSSAGGRPDSGVTVPYPTGPEATSTGSTSPEGEVERAQSVAALAANPPKSGRVRVFEISTGARSVIEAYRLAHGLRSVPTLNPTQAQELEAAVADLGPDRLLESVRYMAGLGVRELVKAIRAAKTKRHNEEQGATPKATKGAGRGTAARPASSLATLGADEQYLSRDWDKEIGAQHAQPANGAPPVQANPGRDSGRVCDRGAGV